MQEIIEGVEKLAYEELERANVKFPLFQSAHEGYAVILEEVEEVEAELEEIKFAMKKLWRIIKYNETDLARIDSMKRYATNLAAEAIQVVAMCNKFKESEVWK